MPRSHCGRLDRDEAVSALTGVGRRLLLSRGLGSNTFPLCSSAGFPVTVPPLLPPLPARKATQRGGRPAGARAVVGSLFPAHPNAPQLPPPPSPPPPFLPPRSTQTKPHPPSSARELYFAPGQERAGRKHASIPSPLAFPFASPPHHHTPSRLRRGEAAFALREAGLLFWPRSRELSDLSRDPTPDLCARETPLLPFPWLAARRPHGRSGAPVRAGRGASGPDSPAGSACRGGSGATAWGRPAPWSRSHVRAAGPDMPGRRGPGTETGPGGRRGCGGAPDSGAGVF